MQFAHAGHEAIDIGIVFAIHKSHFLLYPQNRY